MSQPYHHGDLRHALIAAAIEILEIDGIGALSLRAVARRAGVSQTAPYRHFRNKEALLAAVAAEGFRGLIRHMSERAEGAADPATRVTAIGVGYVAFATRHPAQLRLMFGPEIQSKPDHPELIGVAREAYAMLSGTIAERLALDDAATVDPVIATLASWSMVHGLALLLVDRQINPNMTGGVEIGTDALSARIIALFGEALTLRPD
jgi:AcrR family transcriptional regulator